MPAANWVQFLSEELPDALVVALLEEVIGQTTDRFFRLYKKLPPQFATEAGKALQTWKADPFNPRLQFKKIPGKRGDWWSMRVFNTGYRIMGERIASNQWVWQFVGNHRDYERFIAA